MKDTLQQYTESLAACRSVFLKKHEDYGSAWRILRLPSLTDQMFIKASRIRSLQEKGVSKVGDGIEGEFRALVNYGVMALVQIGEGGPSEDSMSLEEVTAVYDRESDKVQSLMQDKNHDYGEAWRDMRVSSMTDLILMKLLRIKQIEDNDGETQISEGVDGNYSDIINYALFALIKLSERNS